MGEYTNNTCHRKTIHTVSRKKTNSVSVQVRALFFFILFSCFFKALGGWVKIKLKLSSHIIHMSCFGLTRAPVSPAGHVAATGLVSMSTPPDPEGSGTVEIATRSRPRLRLVWFSLPFQSLPSQFQVFLLFSGTRK